MYFTRVASSPRCAHAKDAHYEAGVRFAKLGRWKRAYHAFRAAVEAGPCTGHDAFVSSAHGRVACFDYHRRTHSFMLPLAKSLASRKLGRLDEASGDVRAASKSCYEYELVFAVQLALAYLEDPSAVAAQELDTVSDAASTARCCLHRASRARSASRTFKELEFVSSLVNRWCGLSQMRWRCLLFFETVLASRLREWDGASSVAPPVDDTLRNLHWASVVHPAWHLEFTIEAPRMFCELRHKLMGCFTAAAPDLCADLRHIVWEYFFDSRAPLSGGGWGEWGSAKW